MTKEKWLDVLQRIKDKFETTEHESEHIDEFGGIDREWVIFSGPMGKTKIEYEERPVVEDTKTFYSQRIGSGVQVDYIYGEERVGRMKIFIHNGLDWQEMNVREDFSF